ncbi:MAG: hypothetical protein IT337_11130 [Thermomicrobiales bacterium]|nr:hypothetical protein [Thermomicrobiales bacterium]
MEPRPPRPRTPDPGGLAASSQPIGRTNMPDPFVPAPGYTAQPQGVQLSGEPLLPRQERRRQRVARGVLAFVAALIVLAALGWMARDRILPKSGEIAQDPAAPALVASPAMSVATPSPTAPARAANLLATATPTQPPPAAPTAAPRPAGQPTQAPLVSRQQSGAAAGAAVRLTDLLPTAAQVPAGLQMTEDAERSEAEVVDSLGGSAEAAQLLKEWGWEGNAFRTFVDVTGDLPPGSTTYLNVSVHRFADAAAADDALVYFSDQVVNGPGWEEFPVAPVGDAVRALRGAPDGLPLVVLYVRDGSLVYRIGASSNTADGDPTTDALAVAQTVTAK